MTIILSNVCTNLKEIGGEVRSDKCGVGGSSTPERACGVEVDRLRVEARSVECPKESAGATDVSTLDRVDGNGASSASRVRGLAERIACLERELCRLHNGSNGCDGNENSSDDHRRVPPSDFLIEDVDQVFVEVDGLKSICL